jgi:hypothetical protein
LGTGQTITFSHGWPLDADAWDAQMMFLAPICMAGLASLRGSNDRPAEATRQKEKRPAWRAESTSGGDMEETKEV